MTIDSPFPNTTPSTVPTSGRLMWLGTDVDYQVAWDLQRHLVFDRANGAISDTLLLLEHASR
jgi:lipoate-protein ligase B